MRAVALILALVASLAIAETPQEAQTESDSITLTRAQIKDLEDQIEVFVQKREQAAFERGRMDARQRCASLI